MEVQYSGKTAVRDISFDIFKERITALIGPSGCGKSTLIRCLNRMNDLIPGADGQRHDPLPRRGPLRLARRPGAGAQADRDGVPEAEPVPEVDLRQHRLRPARARHEGRHGRDRRAGAAPRRALGRGEGPSEDERLRHVGRPAAAALHRALPRDRARRDPDGRAVLGARSDLDRPDRGPDDGAARELLDRDRHPQHAAGRARLRQDGVLHRRGGRRRTTTASARWSSTTTPRRSSPPRPTSARRRTSPARWADRGPARQPPAFPGRDAAARGAGARRARPGGEDARPHARGDPAPGRRAGRDRDRRRRPDRRSLPAGAPGRAVAPGAAGAGRHRPPPGRGGARRDQAHRAHGRPVRERREDDPAGRPRAAARARHPAGDRPDGRAGEGAGATGAARRSGCATSRWPRTWSVRTTRSTS